MRPRKTLSPFDPLCPRELRVARLIAAVQNEERTVDNHRTNAVAKLGQQGCHALPRFALEYKGEPD